jgi:hypothetical protein
MFCGEGQGAAADSLKVFLLNLFRKKDFALRTVGPILKYLLHHLLSLFPFTFATAFWHVYVLALTFSCDLGKVAYLM